MSGDWEEGKGKKWWPCNFRKEWKKQITWGFMIYKQQILQVGKIESFITILQIWEVYLNSLRIPTFPVTEMMLHGLFPLPAITHIKKWHQEYTKYICSNFMQLEMKTASMCKKRKSGDSIKCDWESPLQWDSDLGFVSSACRCCYFSNKTHQETSHQWNWNSILSWEKYV